MQQVINWLMQEGRLQNDVLSFVSGLYLELNKAGIPVCRGRIGFKTIHPQLDIWSYVWSRDKGETIEWGGEHGIRESASYYGSPAQWVHTHKKPFRRRLDELDPETDHSILFEQHEQGLIDYLMLPMRFMDASIPVITFVTDEQAGFSDEEVSFLIKLSDYIAPIIEVHAFRKVAVTLLDTYVGHRSGERVLQGHIQRGDGEEIEAAIWFCDLRNFTELSTRLPETELFDLLNEYFQIISDSISEGQGEILKFIGDAVLAVFPTDEIRTKEDTCCAALKAAQSALIATEKRNKTADDASRSEFKFGIGLHFGKAMYGNVGSNTRLDFTVIGSAVNLAARIETLTKTEEKDLLFSSDFAHAIDTTSIKIGEFQFKGMRELASVYQLD